MAGLGKADRMVLDTLLPSGADSRLSGGFGDLDFDSFYREFATSAPPAIRLAFRVSLLSATWLAPLLIGKLPPLGRHGREVREHALQAMAASQSGTLRQLVTLQKTVVSLAYGADANVREAIGYSRALEHE